MADEEKVVEEKKKSGGGGGILPLITLVLVVASLGISVFSLIQIQGAVTAIKTAAEEAAKPAPLPGEVPLSELDTYTFAAQFITIYEDVPNNMKNTVVCNISIGLHKTEDTMEELTALKATLTEKENIIRSGLEGELFKKTYDDWRTPQAQTNLKEDLTQYLQERLGSNLIIDVYINNYVTSSQELS